MLMLDSTEGLLFHITPSGNAPSILETGLEPVRAHSKVKRVYAVEAKMVGWALLHCSARWAVPVMGLSVFVLDHSSSWKRFNRGIWYCEKQVNPVGVTPTDDFIPRDQE